MNGKSFDVRRNTLIDDYLVEETGLSGFYPSRDYYKFRNTSSTLESYISSARDDLIFVSISLVKGINFDDLRNVLIKKISTQTESGNDFKVIISLLNPDKEFLMESLASVFEKDINSIRDEIKQTAKKLKELKKKLPNKKKKNLILRYHNAIPFGSAIIIDKDAKYGKIQIETKPYKSPHNKSFAFEIIPVAENGFFVTLVNAYEELIKDGEPMK